MQDNLPTQPDLAMPGDELGNESGQTTAEYALLTGAIALVVTAVAAWATSTGKIGQLMDAVFRNVINAIT